MGVGPSPSWNSSTGVMSESAGSSAEKSASAAAGPYSMLRRVSAACCSNMPSHDTEVPAPVGEASRAALATCRSTSSRSTWNSSTLISGCDGSSAGALSLSKRIRSERMLARRSDMPPASMGGITLIAMSTTSVAMAKRNVREL